MWPHSTYVRQPPSARIINIAPASYTPRGHVPLERAKRVEAAPVCYRECRTLEGRSTLTFHCLSRCLPPGPRRNMLVFQVFMNQLEIGSVVGHQRCSRFPARGRQEEIVDQRLRKTPEFSSFFPRHHGNRGPCLVPGRMARRYHAPGPCQRPQQVLSNLSDFRWSTRPDNQFVKDNGAEMGVRREIREVALEFLRTFLTSKRSHIEVRIQYVFLHGSTSPSNTFSTPPLPATRRTPAINSSRRSRAESA